jgi:cytochrome c peroxidase
MDALRHQASRVGLFAILVGTWLLPGPAQGEDWHWQVPPGFSVPAVPADNPLSQAKVALGARLFSDTRLSINGRYSCASCHDPKRAFTTEQPLAIGAQGDALPRNAPTLLNSLWNPSLGWIVSGAGELETQMLVPLLAQHPVELGFAWVEPQSLREIAADASYSVAFATAFSGDAMLLSRRNIVRAIASYERTLISADSAFDRYLFGDKRDALTAAALRGMKLFFGERTGCSQCHSGILFSGPVRSAEAPLTAGLFANNGHGDPALQFRVPTLRNVALTAPYMHDGALPTLAAIMAHYSARGRGAQPSAPPLRLSQRERLDLQAFLESLTDRAYQ